MHLAIHCVAPIAFLLFVDDLQTSRFLWSLHELLRRLVSVGHPKDTPHEAEQLSPVGDFRSVFVERSK